MINVTEQHKNGTNLRDIILGGQDGLVNVLGVVLGVVAAGGENRILIAASLAAAFAEAVSMGAVAYTSTMAERDYYLAELKRENHEIDTVPETERSEVEQIYAAKGFSGKLLTDIVDKITSNKENWVNVMMYEELHLKPVDTKAVLRTSIVVGVTALIGAFIPVTPFLIFPVKTAMIISLTISTLALFFVGVYLAKTLVGVWWKNGLQLALIGMGAAIAGFLVGKIFQVA